MATPYEMVWTDNFLEALKRDSFLQSVQGQFTDQQLLDVCREQVVRRIVAQMVAVKRDHIVEPYDITLLADVGRYDLPPYAMYDMLRRARLVEGGGRLRKLLRASRDDVDQLEGQPSGVPRRVAVEGSEIVLYPAPSAGQVLVTPTLRTWIYRRIGKLVRAVTSGTEIGRAAQVSTAPVSGVVTYTGDKPSVFTSSSTHDFYRGTYPYRRIATGKVATASPGTTQQTFAEADAELLAAGDWVLPINETCFLGIPDEIVPAAKDMTIRSLAATQGDRAKVADQLQAMAEAAVGELGVLGDRMDGHPPLISLRGSPFVGGRGRPSSFTDDGDW